MFAKEAPLAMIFGFVLMLGLLTDIMAVPSLVPLAAPGSRTRAPLLRLPGLSRKRRQADRETLEE